MRQILLVPFVVALLNAHARIADASPCVAGTVASLLGTTCTIGDVEFTFYSAASDSRWGGVNHPTGADAVMLTPDPAPGAPGFTWSGSFVLNSAPGELDNVLRFQVVLGAKSLVSDTRISGIGAAVAGVQSTPGGGGFVFAQAQNSNWPCAGPLCTSHATATATQGSDNDTASTTPFVAYDFGLVQFFAEAQNGGNISFDSVSFHFVISARDCACDAGTSCAGNVAPAGTVCRGSIGECDVDEICNGTTRLCPSDGVAPAGALCSGGTCDASGTCVPAPAVPSVSAPGAIAMVLLLISAMVARLRRR